MKTKKFLLLGLLTLITLFLFTTSFKKEKKPIETGEEKIQELTSVPENEIFRKDFLDLQILQQNQVEEVIYSPSNKILEKKAFPNIGADTNRIDNPGMGEGCLDMYDMDMQKCAVGILPDMLACFGESWTKIWKCIREAKQTRKDCEKKAREDLKNWQAKHCG